jgi:DNA-binding NarL/FixJ family response regulator
MLAPMSEVQQGATAVLEPARPVVRRTTHPAAGHPHLRALPAEAEDRVLGTDRCVTEARRVTKVTVFARDAILRAGVTGQLRAVPGLDVVEQRGVVADSVAMVVADELDGEVIGAIRAIRRCGCDRIVVVASRFSRSQADQAVRSGVCGLLRRSDALPHRLAEMIAEAARGHDPVAASSQPLTQLLDGPADPEPGATPCFGLTTRDVEVLRLMAEGESTAAIARAMAYSESTIKNTIHTIVRQLGARNRAHAVATALRVQVI